jgi:DNA-binding NarL/FixJ family response regulator
MLGLVDEHPIVLDALDRLFSPVAEYKIVGRGGSARQALAIAEQLGPDVMILDLSHSSTTLEVTASLRSRYPRIRVVAFSATSRIENAVQVLEAGAKGFVAKTCAVEELLRAVEAAVRNEIYVSQNFAADVVAALRNASVRKVAAQALKLSLREDQIVRLLMQGKTNREIAAQLSISEKTVKHYMSVLMQKLNARSRTEVVLAAHEFSRGGEGSAVLNARAN